VADRRREQGAYTPDLAAAITDDKVKQSSTALAALGRSNARNTWGRPPSPTRSPVRTFMVLLPDDLLRGAVYMKLALSGPQNKVAFIGFNDKLHDDAEATRYHAH